MYNKITSINKHDAKNERSVVDYTPFCYEEVIDADFENESENMLKKGMGFLSRFKKNKEEERNKEFNKEKWLRKIIDLEVHVALISIRKWAIDNEKKLKLKNNIYFFLFLISIFLILGSIIYFSNSILLNFSFSILFFLMIFRAIQDLLFLKNQLKKMCNGNMSSMEIDESGIKFKKGLFRFKLIKIIFTNKLNKDINEQKLDFLLDYKDLNIHWLKTIGVKSLFIDKQKIGYNLFSFLSLTGNLKKQIIKGKENRSLYF